VSADIDALAESARNRSLKLVRSRVRSPTKRRFGKVGLTDSAGKPVFGMNDKGPAAKPEEVEEYLRGLGADDWTASLGSAAAARARKKAKATPKPKPKPAPPPKPEVRAAKAADVPALVELITSLGAKVEEKGVRKRLAALAKSAAPPLVATLGKAVVGVAGLHVMPTLHREKPVGRINVLVIAKDHRGAGLGRLLVETAEARLRAAGCELIEITSNDSLTKAHDFYRHLGYQRTSTRFAKEL
jgi:GNAT superfamily N-acetyltransferase